MGLAFWHAVPSAQRFAGRRGRRSAPSLPRNGRGGGFSGIERGRNLSHILTGGFRAFRFAASRPSHYPLHMDSREALIALNMVEGIGPVRARSLLEHFGEASKILAASPAALMLSCIPSMRAMPAQKSLLNRPMNRSF